MKIVYKALLKRNGKLLSSNPYLGSATVEYSTSEANSPKGKSVIYTFDKLISAKTFIVNRMVGWKCVGLINNNESFELWRCSATGVTKRPDVIPVNCADDDFAWMVSNFVEKNVLKNCYLTNGADGSLGVKKLKLLKKLKVIKV